MAEGALCGCQSGSANHLWQAGLGSFQASSSGVSETQKPRDQKTFTLRNQAFITISHLIVDHLTVRTVINIKIKIKIRDTIHTELEGTRVWH